MRLRRLDLERYGRFTDRSFDFGERWDGPDLHVVYGPNEAGKSTLFNGFLDLLYGIKPNSDYGFLHPYPTMRIAAALDVGGAEREVVRIKKPANSLLDPTGRALPEAVLSSALGGIGRDAYRAMFSLDDDSLEGGGKAILDSRGDLGELLFSASAGLADLSRRLVDVRAVADGFYRYRAHSGGLQDLKARLAALKAEREAIDMGALEYVRLVETRDAASARYAEAVAERGSHQARLEAIGARLGALPRLGALRELRARLSSLAHLPDPPPHWPEAAPLLAREAVELAASAAGIDAELARLAEEEAAIVLDEPVLAAEHRLAAVAALRPRAETAGQDLPRSRLAIREEEAAVAALLVKIGRAGESDPQRLLLPIRTVSALRNAIEARSGVVAAFEAARTALSQAEAGLDDARGRLAERGGDPRQDGEGRDVAIVALEAAVRAAQVSDHASRARAAGRAATEARAELGRRCAAMRFVGDPLDLRSAPVPAPDAVAAWKVHEASLDAEDSRLDAEALRLKAEILRLEGERVLLDHAGALSSETEVARARKDRERAWAEHRTSLAAATADAFEAAMRRDDLVAAARVADAADRARLRQVEESIARSAAALSSRGPEGERQLARRARHAAAISDAWSRAGVVDPIPETGAVALETCWRAGRRFSTRSRRSTRRYGKALKRTRTVWRRHRRCAGRSSARAFMPRAPTTSISCLPGPEPASTARPRRGPCATPSVRGRRSIAIGSGPSRRLPGRNAGGRSRGRAPARPASSARKAGLSPSTSCATCWRSSRSSGPHWSGAPDGPTASVRWNGTSRPSSGRSRRSPASWARRRNVRVISSWSTVSRQGLRPPWRRGAPWLGCERPTKRPKGVAASWRNRWT